MRLDRPDPLASLLAADTTVVIDGGLATELEAAGHDLSDRLWSARLLVEEPEAIVAAHLAYFRAGAQVATSSSYQATFEGFAARGLDRTEAAAMLRRSVELAGRARQRFEDELAAAGKPARTVLVAASVGPYGAMLADGSEYRGDYGRSRRELADWHRERLTILSDAGPDLLAIETIPTIEEGAALVELLAERDGPPAWLSFSCADGATTRRGEPVEEAFALADRADRVVAVGVNCTAPSAIDELVARARAVTAKPIVVYPNRGETWDAATRRWRPTGAQPDVDGVSARRWVTLGARLVGGCCRVGPERIAEIAAALRIAETAW